MKFRSTGIECGDPGRIQCVKPPGGEPVRSFIIPDRKQKLLLTEVDLDTVAPLGSVLRYIDELVEMLDTSEIEKTYDLDSEKGREPIHPKTHIKVG